MRVFLLAALSCTSASAFYLPTPRTGSSSLKMAATLQKAPVFTKDLGTPDPVPDAGVQRAVEIMESGRMYRYNVPDSNSEVSLAERDFAAYTGHKYCIGLNSCGSAIFLGLKCAGVQHGDKVLCNGFSFNAVPSAIEHAGAQPVYVETDPQGMLLMDLDDLEQKIIQNPDTKYLLLTHMRGKVLDMDGMKAIADKHGLTVIEDCAHALGVLFNGKQVGHWAQTACYSSQSYKMINSGEGGFLCTDDDEVAAKAYCYAGCYEQLYQKHIISPPDEVFDRVKKQTPNYSLRMHSLTAAVIRPQILSLEDRIEKYNRRFYKIGAALNAGSPHINVPDHHHKVRIVGDSIQFMLSGLTKPQVSQFLETAKERGVPMGLFGSADNARNFRNWQFSAVPEELPVTEEVISVCCDLRLPLMFEDADFDDMAEVLIRAMEDTMAGDV